MVLVGNAAILVKSLSVGVESIENRKFEHTSPRAVALNMLRAGEFVSVP